MNDDQDNIVGEMTPTNISPKTNNKLSEAEELIEASQELVAKVDADIAECKVGISKAAEEFDNAKRAFNNVTFKNCETLLEKVGFEYITFEEKKEFELAIDANDTEAFSVKSLNSGRFTGLLLAIFVAVSTVAGWMYLAMLKLNIDPSSVNQETAISHVHPVLTWMSGDLVSGDTASMIVGALILGFSALSMAWLVYAIRTTFKGKKNLRIAKDAYVKSNEYCMSQEECKKEIQKVDAHLREAIIQIDNFEMMLGEQSSVLKRILYVEGIYDEEKEYHPSSKKVMRETEKIMKGAENLLSTAITTNRKLNFQSLQALGVSEDIYNEYLSRIYD